MSEAQTADPIPEAPADEEVEDKARALALLAREDERQTKLHDLLEIIREQIRVGVAAEHRPIGLMQNIQSAVYAMRGRTALMNDAAITNPLRRSAETDKPVEPLSEGEIAKLIKQHFPWQSHPKALSALTYEKSPPLFPQATYDVPKGATVDFVRAIEARYSSAAETDKPGVREAALEEAAKVAETITQDGDYDLEPEATVAASVAGKQIATAIRALRTPPASPTEAGEATTSLPDPALTDAIEWLETNQRQLDQDGIEVAVSRQALEQVLAALKDRSHV